MDVNNQPYFQMKSTLGADPADDVFFASELCVLF